MQRYEKYKDSGVKWIGEIPEHWDAIRLKFVGKPLGGLTYSPNDICNEHEGTIVLRSSNIKDEKLTFYDNVYVNKELKESDFVKEGDILICSRNGSADLVGKCAIIEKPIKAAWGAFMMLFRPTLTDNSRYVFYLSQVCIKQYKATFKTSTINQLTNSLFGNIYCPFTHDYCVQQAIVSFLDAKTEKIDQYIAQKEKEIERLQELKQVEIANAVTHGLNPNAKMKPSGIAWIGDIPEEWEVKSLRHFLKLVSIKGFPEKPLLSVTREKGVIVRNLDESDENHNVIPEDLSGYKLVKEGQFVINKMKSWQGSYGVSDFDGIVSPAYFVCELNFHCKKYFNLAIRSKAYVPFFTQYSKGIRVDQWDLSPIALKSIPFIVPPLSEQQAIVAHIERRLERIDRLAEALRREIGELKELKQRIVSDAVTGKVRCW